MTLSDTGFNRVFAPARVWSLPVYFGKIENIPEVLNIPKKNMRSRWFHQRKSFLYVACTNFLALRHVVQPSHNKFSREMPSAGSSIFFRNVQHHPWAFQKKNWEKYHPARSWSEHAKYPKRFRTRLPIPPSEHLCAQRCSEGGMGSRVRNLFGYFACSLQLRAGWYFSQFFFWKAQGWCWTFLKKILDPADGISRENLLWLGWTTCLSARKFVQAT